jgi:hypothetical protein
LSDDEMALVAAFRISESPIAFARRLVTEVEKIQAAEREATGLPAFGEAHVKRLREAVERGHFEEGYDPDAALWATLIEERLKREDEGPQ